MDDRDLIDQVWQSDVLPKSIRAMYAKEVIDDPEKEPKLSADARSELQKFLPDDTPDNKAWSFFMLLEQAMNCYRTAKIEMTVRIPIQKQIRRAKRVQKLCGELIEELTEDAIEPTPYYLRDGESSIFSNREYPHLLPRKGMADYETIARLPVLLIEMGDRAIEVAKQLEDDKQKAPGFRASIPKLILIEAVIDACDHFNVKATCSKYDSTAPGSTSIKYGGTLHSMVKILLREMGVPAEQMTDIRIYKDIQTVRRKIADELKDLLAEDLPPEEMA